MFRKNYLVKINLPGGIIAAGDLYAIGEAAEKARVADVQFGTRQQLFCKVPEAFGPGFLSDLEKACISFENGKENFPNIVSSYVTEEVFGNSNWVSEGLYKDILDAFDFQPRLKVNLVESQQSLVPYFTGHLNFISSGIGNYWYLYMRNPGTSELSLFPGLIYSPDIPLACRLAEESMTGQPRPDMAGGWTKALSELTVQPIREELRLPNYHMPYYEGFNRYDNRSWLGIYRREELFPADFLKDISNICLQTKIGQLYTTPLKSLLIKGIADADRHLWELALGKHRVNVRHASNELNWLVEDLCEEGLRLKRYLVRYFDQQDLRTEGLCMTIKTRTGTGLSGSVIIRKAPGEYRQRKPEDRYDILYTRDFNPNSREFVAYRTNLGKEELPVYLVSLCKHFYEVRNEEDLRIPYGAQELAVEKQPAAETFFQCSHCLTVFDEQHGDPEQGIPPGKAFVEIRASYRCPLCEGGAEGFREIEKTSLVQA
jgi:rubredoxin